MASKKGTIAAIAASAALATTTVATICRTRKLQSEARAAGAHVPRGPYEAVIKHPLDVILAATAVLAASPVLVTTALVVYVQFGSPVIFQQQRPGLNANLFNMLKFKTMLDPQTRDGRKLTDQERLDCIEKGVDILSDEERLTALGRFLRATSLDELPELLNVIKGEMSLVGPRPLATIYLPYYSEEEMRRHDVRPGLTGLAQIHGRNTASWTDRFSYDVSYVDDVTFLGDMKIIGETIAVVVKRDGIGQGKERPEPFNTVRQRELSIAAQNACDANGSE